MSDFVDDGRDMTPPSLPTYDDAQCEAVLTGAVEDTNPQLAALLLQVRAIGKAPAPLPSPALAALLDGTPAAVGRRARQWGRRAATVAVLSVGTSGMVVGAAAANVLPQQAQHAVARVVNDITPLRLPGVAPTHHSGPVSPKPGPAATQPTTPEHDDPTVPLSPASHPPAPATSSAATTPAPQPSDRGRTGKRPLGTDRPGQSGQRTPTPGRQDDGSGHGKPAGPPAAKPPHGHEDGGRVGGSDQHQRPGKGDRSGKGDGSGKGSSKGDGSGKGDANDKGGDPRKGGDSGNGHATGKGDATGKGGDPRKGGDSGNGHANGKGGDSGNGDG